MNCAASHFGRAGREPAMSEAQGSLRSNASRVCSQVCFFAPIKSKGLARFVPGFVFGVILLIQHDFPGLFDPFFHFGRAPVHSGDRLPTCRGVLADVGRRLFSLLWPDE